MVPRATVRRSIHAILVGLLCLGLVSCEAPVPSQDDIAGTWTYDLKGSTYKAAVTGGRIEFRNNQTFELEQIPKEVITSEGSDAPTSEKGTWEIVDRQLGLDRPTIHITTSGSAAIPGGYIMDFLVEGSGEDRRLVGMVGDPDNVNRYVLRKR